jgi:hypothetical protein
MPGKNITRGMKKLFVADNGRVIVLKEEEI